MTYLGLQFCTVLLCTVLCYAAGDADRNMILGALGFPLGSLTLQFAPP